MKNARNLSIALAGCLSALVMAQGEAPATVVFRTWAGHRARTTAFTRLATELSSQRGSFAKCHGVPDESIARDVQLLIGLAASATCDQDELDMLADRVRAAVDSKHGVNAALSQFWAKADRLSETERTASEVLEGLLRVGAGSASDLAAAARDPMRAQECAELASAWRDSAGTGATAFRDDLQPLLPAIAPRLDDVSDAAKGLPHRIHRASTIGSATIGLPSLGDADLPFAETPATVERLAVALGAGLGRFRASPRAVVAGGWSIEGPGDKARWLVNARVQLPLPTPTPTDIVEEVGPAFAMATDFIYWRNAGFIQPCADAVTVLGASVAADARQPDAATGPRWASLVNDCVADAGPRFTVGLRAGASLISVAEETGTRFQGLRYFAGVASSYGPADALVGYRYAISDSSSELVGALRLRAKLTGIVYGMDPVSHAGLELAARVRPGSPEVWQSFAGASLSLRVGGAASLIATGGWGFEGNLSGPRFNVALAFDADPLLP